MKYEQAFGTKKATYIWLDGNEKTSKEHVLYNLYLDSNYKFCLVS